jgi:membrane protease YdiL (CAAX protease family)
LLGFVAGGLGVALHVAIYALAGWYHVDSAQFDPLPFLLSGLAGYLVLTALPEELAFRGVLFRGIERGLERSPRWSSPRWRLAWSIK